MMKTLSSCNFGLRKTTLIDYPGEVSAILFLPGCNLRCPYCHNPEMVDPAPEGLVPWEEIKEILLKRKKILGGVCITGGEPLLNPHLDAIISFIREIGLRVKLDTNGSFPEKLKKLDVDYLAMDVKTSPAKYHLLGGARDEKIAETLRWIISSGIDHEFRTTVVPGIVEKEDIYAIIPLLKGARRYILSPFRPGITLDATYRYRPPYPAAVLHEMRDLVLKAGIPCRVRGEHSI